MIAETERLLIRKFTLADAPFILEQVNTPAWRQFISDPNVHSIADAEGYITKGPLASYAKYGFGLYLVTLKSSGAPIGICGPLQRDMLQDPDLGFSLLPAYEGKGYAYEAAAAVLGHSLKTYQPERMMAITTIDNTRSISLLERLGFVFKNMITSGDEELRLFEKSLK